MELGTYWEASHVGSKESGTVRCVCVDLNPREVGTGLRFQKKRGKIHRTVKDKQMFDKQMFGWAPRDNGIERNFKGLSHIPPLPP